MTGPSASDDVFVDVAWEATPDLVEAMAVLVPQLSSSSSPPTLEELAEMVASPATTVLLARDGAGVIVGSLTLATFRIPTGVRAWIEDVVVDGGARGGGVGAALIREAIDRARAVGARTVDLTSRPTRQDAHRLYQRMGFVERDTTVYRWSGADP